ncbi:hypothetical protein ACFL1J_05030 [Pseudomonadota bacterium]
MSATVLAQTQLGSDIDGAVSQLASNYSVSLSADGNRLAIGAHNHDGNGSRSGHTRVYNWSGAAWIQLGSDINGEAVEDYSGGSVSLSSDGNRVAIGADGNDGNGDESGHVRVYHWSGTEWAQLGSDIDGEAIGDQSGVSVSLSSDANRLAIGAPGNDANGPNSGHVRVYQWAGSAWTKLGADIDGEAAWDNFGSSVSLSSNGNHLAIGAPFADGNELGSGQVHVYHWSGSDWVQLGTDIEGEKENNFSGLSVSLSSDGNRLAIGAPFNDGNGRWSGHTRAYQWSGTAWVQIGADIDGEAAEDRSGSSVSLSSDGTRLAIGAPWNDGNGSLSGHVRVYQWSGMAWTKLGTDIDGEAAGDQFGYHVSLSTDGNRVASGSGYADETGVDPGYVRAYDLSVLNTLRINPGLNDAWYNPDTSGQGFFINVFPDLGAVSLAWFTYDIGLPPLDATANLGDPGHRWLTAVGPIDGNQVMMEIEMTSGGIFDTPTEIIRTDPPGSDGTLLLTFDSCSSGTIEYDIPSINRQGTVPIQRVVNDNVVLCEALRE